MKLFEIKHRFYGNVLFKLETKSIKLCIEAAVNSGADLTGAYLRGADGDKIKIEKTPLQILGLHWDVLVFDNHMKIGCEFHSIKEWEGFSDGGINGMDHNALDLWKESKKFLISFCQRSRAL